MDHALINSSEDQKIRSWIKAACIANHCPDLAETIHFKFHKRLTNAMGQAFPRTRLVELSAPLWPRATEQEKKQTVGHEVCHIVAYILHGSSGHDKGWKQCMNNAGLEALLYHKVNRDGLQKQYIKYQVKCNCVSVWIGHTRAAKVRKNLLSCKRCKQKLTFTGETFRPQKSLTKCAV